MPYPAASDYLTRKLHWMARRLRVINEPATITEWMDAMMAVVKVHNVISGIEDLSKPIEVWVKPEMCKETGLNFKSKTAETGGKKTKTERLEKRALMDIGGLLSSRKIAKLATTQKCQEAHTETTIPEQRRKAKVIASPTKRKHSVISKLISPRADDSDSTHSNESDSTQMEVEEGSLALKRDTEGTWTQKLEPIRQSTEQRWQEEALKLISEDLQRYCRLPKGGCRIYIKRKATEDVLGLMKERRRPMTKDELHHILHDHVKRAVPNERDRIYIPC